MPRPARQENEFMIYHIVTRGNNYQTIFECPRDYAHYLDLVREAKERYDVKIFAYCLMSNHLHLLLHSELDPLESFMHKLGTSYSLWYNRKYDRSGHLFQGRYHDEQVKDMRYFKAVLNYIHQNPVSAEMVPCAARYAWSSYQAYASNDTSIVTINPVLKHFPSAEECLRFFDQPSSKKYRYLEYYGKGHVPDFVAREIIQTLTGCANISEYQKMTPEKQKEPAEDLLRQGLSIRQINRLCGLSRRWLSNLEKSIRDEEENI